MRSLFFLLFTVCLSAVICAQDVSIEVSYKKKKHPAFNFKVARPMTMTVTIDDETFQVTPANKDLKKWEIRGNGGFSEATLFSDKVEGIWWEIANPKVITKVLLSADPTDINDPREFIITSSADRVKFMAFNDEPDCNSQFSLVELADSPTLLTGVMRTYGTLVSNHPCDKGKWEVELENRPPDHVLMGWIFATIQSMNVRFMD